MRSICLRLSSYGEESVFSVLLHFAAHVFIGRFFHFVRTGGIEVYSQSEALTLYLSPMTERIHDTRKQSLQSIQSTCP